MALQSLLRVGLDRREGDMDTGRDREPDGQRLKEPEIDDVQTPHEYSPDAPQMQGEEVTTFRSNIHWGSIGAGVLLALTTFLLLELLAIGSGLLTVAGSGAATSVSAIIGVIVFFIGGYVGGLTSEGGGGGTFGVRYTGSAVLQGLLVWALGTVLIVTVSVLGLGQLFGALGEVVNQLTTTLNPNVVPRLSVEAVGNPALVAFFGLLLSALTAALGGWLGKSTSR
jgi:hypothetical protein